MADGGFNFRPVERREVKRFEPPPWEKDQFDEFARRCAEQEARERDTEKEGAGGACEPEAAPTPARTAEESAPATRSAPTPAAPDGARVTAMLAELAAEEPKAPETYWKANAIVGAALAVFGCVFLTWGVAALVGARRTGAAGMFGGSVMLLFGAGFVLGGLWVVVRSLRQRGVL